MTEVHHNDFQDPTPQLKGMMLIICGPSGVGKSTLIHALLQQRPSATMSVSHTTRAPRGDEVDGLNYHFVNEKIFKQMIEEGKFAEHARVHGHYYGTSFAEIEKAWEAERPVVFDIDYQGANQLRVHYPTATSVLIAPPSLQTLKQRLEWRATDTKDVIQKRLAVAVEELSQWPSFDYIIKNEDLPVAVCDLLAIFDATVLRIENNSEWLGEAYPPSNTSND